MWRSLTILLFSMLAACEPPGVVVQATAYLKVRYPQWPIVKAYLAQGGANDATVCVRYIDTPGSQYPPRRSIRETELSYHRTNNQWILTGENGSRFIGPAD